MTLPNVSLDQNQPNWFLNRQAMSSSNTTPGKRQIKLVGVTSTIRRYFTLFQLWNDRKSKAKVRRSDDADAVMQKVE